MTLKHCGRRDLRKNARSIVQERTIPGFASQNLDIGHSTRDTAPSQWMRSNRRTFSRRHWIQPPTVWCSVSRSVQRRRSRRPSSQSVLERLQDLGKVGHEAPGDGSALGARLGGVRALPPVRRGDPQDRVHDDDGSVNALIRRTVASAGTSRRASRPQVRSLEGRTPSPRYRLRPGSPPDAAKKH